MHHILATEIIPTAHTFKTYEQLGNVGILLLILFVFLLVGAKVFGWLKEFGQQVLAQLGKQTMALENVKHSNASMEINQTRLHERLDSLFRCPARPCPLRPTDHVVPKCLVSPEPHHDTHKTS